MVLEMHLSHNLFQLLIFFEGTGLMILIESIGVVQEFWAEGPVTGP